MRRLLSCATLLLTLAASPLVAQQKAATASPAAELIRLENGWTTGLVKRDRALFFSYTGYWLIELYRLTPPAQRAPVRQFLFQAWREGLYDPRARGRFGLRQIGRALLNRLP